MTSNQGSGFQNFVHSAENYLGGQQTQQATQPVSNAGNYNSSIDRVQGLMGHTGQGGTGFQGAIDKAQGFLGQTGQAQQGSVPQQGGLLNTAQGLIGGQQQTGQTQPLQQRFAGLNNTVDTMQGMYGHTGTGGAGIQGYIDKAQGLTGHQGPVGGVQGALNTAEGLMGMQQLAGGYQQGGIQGALHGAQGLIGGQQTQQTGQGGIQGVLHSAQGLIGGQQTQQTGQTLGNAGNLNSNIDRVQGLMGHTGQGGTGFQGAIDKAQGFLGQTGQVQQGNVPQQQGGLLNTAQGLLGSGQNVQNAQPGQTVNRAGGINNAVDRAQGLFGHTGQGGTGINSTIDRAQGFFGHSDQA